MSLIHKPNLHSLLYQFYMYSLVLDTSQRWHSNRMQIFVDTTVLCNLLLTYFDQLRTLLEI